MDFRFPKQRRLTTSDIGLNAVATNAAQTGSTFDATGYNALTLFLHFVRVAATGSIELTLEAYDDIKAAWVAVQDPGVNVAGTVTYSPLKLTKATGSASIVCDMRVTGLNHNKLRIKSSVITAAGDTDLLTVTGILSYQP
jgi:hypothetical protein